MSEQSGPRTQTPAAGRAAAATAFLDAWASEDDVLAGARARAAEVGVRPVSAAAGAALRALAAAASARAVAEVGTGTGVSGLWLLRGMRPDGILTTIDTDGETQRIARAVFAEAGVPTQRTRLITGRAAEVLPRLTDGAYDLVHCDAGLEDAPAHVEAAIRLLRPHGVVVVSGVLGEGRAADQASRDPDALAARVLLRTVHDDARLVPAVLPVGSGLLVAATLPPGA